MTRSEASAARGDTVEPSVGDPEAASSPPDEHQRAATRADAIASRERILEAAAALAGDRRMSMIEVAAAAGVGRSTLYRHFPSRAALERALQERAVETGTASSLP